MPRYRVYLRNLRTPHEWHRRSDFPTQKRAEDFIADWCSRGEGERSGVVLPDGETPVGTRRSRDITAPENANVHPSASWANRFPEDIYIRHWLRSVGIQIESRPRNGEPTWRTREGLLLSHGGALMMARRVEIEEEKKSG